MRYKKGEKSAQQIANELRVEYILEGTIQRERPSDPNSRVRIIPQLIKASNDTHVWAQPYDTDMSGVFRVQSDLAEQVAQALNITLLERERQALQSRPTEDMQAYNYYLRGNEYWHRSYRESDVRIAIRMYEKAVELDPKFASACAQLSRCHAYMYMRRYDYTLERLEMAKKIVDRALQLEPDLPEAHLALGNYYYRGHLDYDRAFEQFAIARKNLPNDSDLLSLIGFVQRRQGRFEEALANIKRASELDPLSNIITYDLADTFALMRDYPQALRCYDRAISLAPDVPDPYDNKAWLYVLWEGSTEKARAVAEEALKSIRSPEESSIVELLIDLEVCEGNYQRALDRLSLKSADIDEMDCFIPGAMRYARIYGYMNEKESAKKYYDEARNTLEAKIQQQPDDARFHSSLGIAYAGLDRREDAIREGKIGVSLLPITKEAMRGPSRVRDLALIYVTVGEFDLAIDQIEFLLSIPGELSISLLRLHPAWAPLREHPRFRKLLGTTE
jgi:tetratricopeptide (TPR) repeat protein